MFEDRVLIWRLKQGSRKALHQIYEKYESDLLTLAANLLKDKSAAEDVVQDVFIGFVESIHKFVLTGRLKAYLLKCAANRCRDIIRKGRRRQTIAMEQAQTVVSNTDGPVQLAIASEQLRRVSSALTELPYEQREVVVLHLQGEMKFKVIAQLQKVSIKTVQSRYRYGLDKLRSMLNGEVLK